MCEDLPAIPCQYQGSVYQVQRERERGGEREREIKIEGGGERERDRFLKRQQYSN